MHSLNISPLYSKGKIQSALGSGPLIVVQSEKVQFLELCKISEKLYFSLYTLDLHFTYYQIGSY